MNPHPAAEEPTLRHTITAVLATAACGLMIAAASPADAKGCLKGAVVGGVAGHMAGHGVLGAAGGCAVGHHMANKSAQNDTSQQHMAGYNQSRQ
jgi:uncharacterized protein YcfJ